MNEQPERRPDRSCARRTVRLDCRGYYHGGDYTVCSLPLKQSTEEGGNTMKIILAAIILVAASLAAYADNPITARMVETRKICTSMPSMIDREECQESAELCDDAGGAALIVFNWVRLGQPDRGVVGAMQSGLATREGAEEIAAQAKQAIAQGKTMPYFALDYYNACYERQGFGPDGWHRK
jgi:hypothetical protein